MNEIALQSAASGHLVLLQMDASSAQEAIENMNKSTKGQLEELLIGAIWQELVPRPSGLGRVANLEMIDGKMATKN